MAKIPITLIKANEQGTFASQIKQLVKNDTNLVMSPMPLLELFAKEQMNEQFEELIKRQQEAVRFFTTLGGKEKLVASASLFKLPVNWGKSLDLDQRLKPKFGLSCNSASPYIILSARVDMGNERHCESNPNMYY